MSRYRCCADSPVAGVDPSGHRCWVVRTVTLGTETIGEVAVGKPRVEWDFDYAFIGSYPAPEPEPENGGRFVTTHNLFCFWTKKVWQTYRDRIDVIFASVVKCDCPRKQYVKLWDALGWGGTHSDLLSSEEAGTIIYDWGSPADWMTSAEQQCKDEGHP